MSSRRLDSPTEGRFIVLPPPKPQVSRTISSVSRHFIVIQRVKLLRHLCEFCSGFSRNSAKCAKIRILFFIIFHILFLPERKVIALEACSAFVSARVVCVCPFCSQPKAEYEKEKKTAAECLISRGKKQNSRYSEHFMAQM